jgi:hypothetical protein
MEFHSKYSAGNAVELTNRYSMQRHVQSCPGLFSQFELFLEITPRLRMTKPLTTCA